MTQKLYILNIPEIEKIFNEIKEYTTFEVAGFKKIKDLVEKLENDKDILLNSIVLIYKKDAKSIEGKIDENKICYLPNLPFKILYLLEQINVKFIQQVYISQSDKGGLVFGGDIDGYNSYAQRGNLDMLEDVCESGLALMPSISKARLLRMWGGIMDMTMDGSPIIDKTHIKGLYMNAGWCYGGFKATPASGWCFAHLIAKDYSHSLSENFKLDRFKNGYMIDEKGQGAQPNLH